MPNQLSPENLKRVDEFERWLDNISIGDEPLQQLYEELHLKTAMRKWFVSLLLEVQREREQVRIDTIAECKKGVPEIANKHDNLVSHPDEYGDTWEHDDARWDYIDISATTAGAFNTCRQAMLEHLEGLSKQNI